MILIANRTNICLPHIFDGITTKEIKKQFGMNYYNQTQTENQINYGWIQLEVKF